MGLLYEITDPDGLVYIGSTFRNLRTRLSDHSKEARGTQSNRPILVSMRRHGRKAMKIACVAVIEDELLSQHENAYIKARGTIYPNGLNLADNMCGLHRRSDESKRRTSEKSAKAWRENPSHVKNLVALQTNEDVQAIKSEAMKDVWSDPDYKRRTGNAISQGLQKDPEREKRRKENISRAHREKMKDPEYVKKMREALARGKAAKKQRESGGV